MLLTLPLLFADDAASTDWRVVALGIFLTAFGGACQYLITQAIMVWRESKATRAGAEKTIVDHQTALIARLECDLDDKDKEIGEKQRKLDEAAIEKANCNIRAATMELHIRYIESVLARNNVPFERYQVPPVVPSQNGTDATKPLTTGDEGKK